MWSKVLLKKKGMLKLFWKELIPDGVAQQMTRRIDPQEPINFRALFGRKYTEWRSAVKKKKKIKNHKMSTEELLHFAY